MKYNKKSRKLYSSNPDYNTRGQLNSLASRFFFAFINNLSCKISYLLRFTHSKNHNQDEGFVLFLSNLSK